MRIIKQTTSYQIRCRWLHAEGEASEWKPLYPNTNHYYTDNEASRQLALRRVMIRLDSRIKETFFGGRPEYKIVKITKTETEEDYE